jgi:Tfp pilus assembly protein PilX
MHPTRPLDARHDRDRGSVLPLVLAASFVLGLVVVAIAGYVTAALRYSNVVEERADRLAAADGGLRYGVEKLRNFQTLCTTGAGTGTGYTTIFPPTINGAVAEVTCRRVGNPISDVQGWGVVVTGQGVPSWANMFTTQGAGGSNNVKTFSGPVYIADPTRIDLNSALTIENGDLWYTRSNCDAPVSIPGIGGYLQFAPTAFRGPLCTPLAWNTMFTAPTPGTIPTSPVNPAYTTDGSCRVFSPGKYTSLQLGTDNYFKAGSYYFENVAISLQNQSLVGGFPGGAGDSQKVPITACAAAQASDQATTLAAGGRGGATFYLGGTSDIEVRNGAKLEIYRRLQGSTYLSVFALSSFGTGYTASTLGWSSWIIETQSGGNNDLAIHGLVWAPRTGVTLGNVANAANGQLLGGVVTARLDVQASASASAFAVGIETNPIDVRLLLASTATKNGRSTTVRAVVQFRPDSGELAINSWRVVN